MTSTSGPALRADAARNRAAIVAAAADLMAREGTAVSVEAVARAAGVGSATLHRRFSSAAALVEAVLEQRMADYADTSARAAEAARTQPWEALTGFLEALVDLVSTDRALGEVISSPTAVSEAFAEDRARAFTASATLVRRVRSAGVVRPDFAHSDLLLLAQAVSGLTAADREAAPAAARRLLSLFLQAVRVPADAHDVRDSGRDRKR